MLVSIQDVKSAVMMMKDLKSNIDTINQIFVLESVSLGPNPKDLQFNEILNVEKVDMFVF